MKLEKMYIFVFIGICVLMGSPKAYAWRIVYYIPEMIRVHYDLKQDCSYNKQQVLEFPKNLYYPFSSESTQGVNILQYGKLGIKNVPIMFLGQKKRYYLKKFDNPILCRKDTTILTFYFYQKNIKKYSIYLHTTTNIWKNKDFICDFDGFQYPIQIHLSDFFSSFDSIIPAIDTLLILIETDEGLKKEAALIANKLSIEDFIQRERTFSHPLWDRLFHRSNADSVYNYMENDPAVFRNTYNHTLWDCMYFIRDTDGENELYMIKNVLYHALFEYPFYDERALDKRSIIQKLERLYADQASYSDEKLFLEDLEKFLRKEINDGHFFLKLPSLIKKRQISPVRLYEVAGKVLVSAVFDSTYVSFLPLGTEVLAVKGKKIAACIDSLKREQYGVDERKRSRAIASLLNGYVGDTLILTIKKNNKSKIEEINLVYTDKIHIPPNFKLAHGLFECKNDIAYFRIAQMDGKVFLRFVNHVNKIKKCKGLILDLRGNSGGSPDGELLFSSFIQRPTVYCHIGFNNSDRRRESIVIQPHKSIRIPSDFPIIILGDENTACASEAFIQAMQQLDNCSFLSHSPTAGSLQNRYGVIFPSGVFLSLDCLTEKIYSIKDKVIECTGLVPDIWVQYRTIDDLAPYKDILKVKAFELLEAYEMRKSLILK